MSSIEVRWSWLTNAQKRIAHSLRLIGEFTRYAIVHRRVWPLLFIVALLLISALLIVSQAALPFLYTIF